MKAGQPRRTVLSEDSYIELVLRRGMRKKDIHTQYGVSMNVIDVSTQHYKAKYEREIKEVQRRNYATAASQRRPRAMAPPAILLNEDRLRQKVTAGKKLSVLATELGVSEFILQRNLGFYKIVLSPELPYRLQHVDESFLQRVEAVSPGFLEAAYKFYDNPYEYYLRLYQALGDVVDLLHFIKDQGKGHDYYVQAGKIERDHICWNTNRHELRLSGALTRAGIPHQRQVSITGRGGFLFDFWLTNTNVFVEVDGDFHERDEGTKERDARKNAYAARQELCLLRFTTKQIEEDLNGVLTCVQASLKAG